MAEEIILTLDLGTTRLKVAAFNLQGECRGRVARRNLDRRNDDGSDQQAEGWWRSCQDAIHGLMHEGSIDPRQIVGVSLSGRAGAAVFLDGDGNVVVDPWSDARHQGEQRRLRDRVPMPNYALALLAKAAWLRHDAPTAFARVAHILYAKDFLMYRLTGETVTDPSSGPDGPWHDDWLLAANLTPSLLPRVAHPATIAGTVTAAAASQCGLLEGTPVAVGAHDGICANTGAGVIQAGEFCLTLGTHGVVRTVVDSLPTDALRFYCYPDDRHVIGANAFMAGRAIDWFIDNWFDTTESNREALFAHLDTQLTPPVDIEDLHFFPYLGGQLAPIRRPNARATFSGLSTSTNRDDMYRAVVRGVSFAIAEVYDQVCDWAGPPHRVGVTGSGVASTPWLSMLANTLATPLEITDQNSEGRGAAIFCATALGYYATVPLAIDNMVHTTAVIEPDTTRQRYQALRQRWQATGERLVLDD